MADSTRSKTNMDRIKEAIAKITSNQLNLITAQNAINTKLDELLQRMAHFEATQHSTMTTTSMV